MLLFQPGSVEHWMPKRMDSAWGIRCLALCSGTTNLRKGGKLLGLLWSLSLAGLTVLSEVNLFRTTTNSNLDVGKKARMMRGVVTVALTLPSVLYSWWNGRELYGLFRRGLALNRGRDRPLWYWSQGMLVSCGVLYIVTAGMLVFGNPELWDSNDMKNSLFLLSVGSGSIVVAAQMVAHPLLYSWMCSEIALFQHRMTVQVRQGALKPLEWLNSRKGMEYLARDLNRVYGPLCALHLLIDGVLAILYLYLLEETAQLATWSMSSASVAVVCRAVIAFFTFPPLAIFHFSASWVSTQDELFWRTMSSAAIYVEKEETIASIYDPVVSCASQMQEWEKPEYYLALFYKARKIHFTAFGFTSMGKESFRKLLEAILTYSVVMLFTALSSVEHRMPRRMDSAWGIRCLAFCSGITDLRKGGRLLGLLWSLALAGLVVLSEVNLLRTATKSSLDVGRTARMMREIVTLILTLPSVLYSWWNGRVLLGLFRRGLALNRGRDRPLWSWSQGMLVSCGVFYSVAAGLMVYGRPVLWTSNDMKNPLFLLALGSGSIALAAQIVAHPLLYSWVCCEIGLFERRMAVQVRWRRKEA
ncbi:unnamed protein product [Darwinula stevensoni]|uniref:Uncharacterized protein n=1 Tax=Darwinula stevensoni TaxID=69355 RepID=A0A7R8X629_9CRUS|nr:unnamed protein product [Darwinula stevensoni]CAG0880851.1 unnamed protein product [Darwinula stevensoni]